MPSILSNANATVTIKRVTAYLLDLIAVAASHTVNRQPVRQSCVQVRLTGSPSGTVTIAGTVSGAADVEVLTWTGAAGARSTFKQFTAISGITTSLTGATLISAEAVEPGGAPQVNQYSLKTGHPCSFKQLSKQWFVQLKPGEVATDGAEMRLQYEETWAPRIGDLVLNEQTLIPYEIKGFTAQPEGSFAPMFWRCVLDMKPGAI